MPTVTINHAKEINKLHQEFEAGLRTQRDIGIQLGELLTEQKAEVPHGEWKAWLTANVAFSDRTASRWMKWYKDRSKLKSATVAVLATEVGKAYAKKQARPKKKQKTTADKPTKDRSITFTVKQHTEFKQLIGKLQEYHQDDSATQMVLRALRDFYKEQTDAHNSARNGASKRMGSGTNGQVPGRGPLRPGQAYQRRAG